MRGIGRFIVGVAFLVGTLAATKYILRRTQFAHFADAY
jgi:hypothetical protein